MELEQGMRVVMVGEEPDKDFRAAGAVIPIGTTGTVYEPYNGKTTHPITKEDEALCTVIWDFPYRAGAPNQFFNHDGLTRFEVFRSMIAPIDEEKPFEPLDFSGIFD